MFCHLAICHSLTEFRSYSTQFGNFSRRCHYRSDVTSVFCIQNSPVNGKIKVLSVSGSASCVRISVCVCVCVCVCGSELEKFERCVYCARARVYHYNTHKLHSLSYRYGRQICDIRLRPLRTLVILNEAKQSPKLKNTLLPRSTSLHLYQIPE